MPTDRELEELKRRLRILRLLRFFGHVPLFTVLIVAGVLALFGRLAPHVREAIWSDNLFQALWTLLWILAIAGFCVSFFLPGAKCPRCKAEFHFKRWGLLYIANEFSRACMNCGLRLDGKGELRP